MNLLEWEVGIPGKTNVRVIPTICLFLMPHCQNYHSQHTVTFWSLACRACLTCVLTSDATFSDCLGGRAVQIDYDLS